jgi:hypothetical protein
VKPPPRISAREPGLAEHHLALRHISALDDGLAPLGCHGRQIERRAGRGQIAERPIQQHTQLVGADVASDTDDQIVLGQAARHERPEIGHLEPGHALERAAHRPAIGLAGKSGLEPGQARQVIRILRAAPQARLDLIADPVDRLGIEAWRAQRQPQQLEGTIAILGQRLELTGEAVALGVERQLDRQILELGAKRLAVQLSRSFVEQARDHVGEALLADRIERRPAGKMDRHRQEGNRRLAHQIGPNTAWAGDLLDLGRSACRRHGCEHSRCHQGHLPATLNHCHPARPP